MLCAVRVPRSGHVALYVCKPNINAVAILFVQLLDCSHAAAHATSCPWGETGALLCSLPAGKEPHKFSTTCMQPTNHTACIQRLPEACSAAACVHSASNCHPLHGGALPPPPAGWAVGALCANSVQPTTLDSSLHVGVGAPTGAFVGRTHCCFTHTYTPSTWGLPALVRHLPAPAQIGSPDAVSYKGRAVSALCAGSSHLFVKLLCASAGTGAAH